MDGYSVSLDRRLNLETVLIRENTAASGINKEESLSLMRRCISSHLGAQINAIDNPEAVTLLASSVDFFEAVYRNNSSSSESKTSSSSSFEESMTVPNTDASLEHTMPIKEAGCSRYSSYLCGTSNSSSSSFDDILLGEGSSNLRANTINETATNAQSLQPLFLHGEPSGNLLDEHTFGKSPKVDPDLNELIRRLSLAAENTAATLRTSRKEKCVGNPVHGSGIVPKILSRIRDYPFLTENTRDRADPPFCKFCFKNKEPPYLYNTHHLKDAGGIITTCPVLRKYVCPICGTSGDFAHTVKFCCANPKRKFNRQASSSTAYRALSGAAKCYTASSHSTPNNSLSRLPPLSSFTNIQEESTLRQTPKNYSRFQGQLQSQFNSNSKEIDTQVLSSTQCTFDMYNSNSANKPAGPKVKHHRFQCAFPSANLLKHKKIICKFCRKNKRPTHIYQTHELRDDTGKVVCPFLRKHVCFICGATGNDAHTRKYCPQNSYEEFIQFMQG